MEAGYALRGDATTLLIKSEKSSNDVEIPANLKRYKYIGYKDRGLANISNKIASAIHDFVEKTHPKRFYLRPLWELGEVNKTTIACSRIPMKESATEFEEYIEHRQYGDLDALISLRETLHRLYPTMDLNTVIATSKNELRLKGRNLILLGGIELNPVFVDFEMPSPFSYDWDSENKVYVRDGVNDELLQFEFNESAQRASDYGFL